MAGLHARPDIQRETDSSPEPTDLYRTPAVNGCIVAALALVIGTPLPDGTVGFDGDVVPVSRGNHHNVAESSAKIVEFDFCRQRMGGAVSGAVAKLADVIPAPLPKGVVGSQGGGMPVAARNGDDVAQSGDLHWIRAIIRAAVAYFAEVVLSPGPNCMIGPEGERVIHPAEMAMMLERPGVWTGLKVFAMTRP